MSARVRRLIAVGSLLSVLVALGGRPARSAENLQLRRCTKVTAISNLSGAEAMSDLSDTPSLICSIDFVPTSANGFVRVFDSPDDTYTHAQAVTVGEASGATAINSAHAYYGELGRLTQFGLDVEVYRGVAIISWES